MKKYKLPPLPEGYRTVRYEILNKKEHSHQPGIYVLYVGEKFYIGKAKNVVKRIQYHKSIENMELGRYLFGNLPKATANINIIKHLADNPTIEIVYAEILEVCTIETISTVEKEWIMAVCHAGFGDLLLNLDMLGCSHDTYCNPYEFGLME